MLWLGWTLRLGIAMVAAWVLFSLAPLILDEIRGIDACPMLGPVPACFPVGLGYIAMAISVIISPRKLTWLFLLGWTPVFLLALSGSAMEIFGRPTCPISPEGTPLCYFSLALASLLLPAFILGRYLQPSPKRESRILS